MSLDENKALVRDYITELYASELGQVRSVLDRFVAAHYVAHCPWKDRDGWEKVVTDYIKARGALEYEIEDILAEGDRVVVRGVIGVVREGAEKHGSTISIYRLEGGKIVEEWSHGEGFY
jgi:predicted ester cyclase